MLTLYGHNKTTEQRTDIQQYGELIGTLAADGWAVTFGTARRGMGGLQLRPVSLLAVPNVTANQSTASIPTLCYLMWHYNYLCTLKG